jgi:hypothetical protein
MLKMKEKSSIVERDRKNIANKYVRLKKTCVDENQLYIQDDEAIIKWIYITSTLNLYMSRTRMNNTLTNSLEMNLDFKGNALLLVSSHIKLLLKTRL